MKVSNETKVGALTVIAVVLLILGYNLLKGRNLFTPTNTFYTKMSYNPGIAVSTPVDLDGFKVGTVTDIEMTQGAKSEVIIEFTVNKKFKISKDAVVASFSTSILGGTGLKIYNGDINGPVCKHKDTIAAKIELGMVESLAPTLTKIKESLTSFLNKLDTSFTQDAGKDLNAVLANLKDITANVKVLTVQTNDMVAKEKIKLDATLSNAESITDNFKSNNEDITVAVKNLRKTTDQLAQADLKKTIEDAQKTINELKTMIAQINGGQGTLGMLATDKKLYESLLSATANLDAILKELQKNPGKYVPFKKNKK